MGLTMNRKIIIGLPAYNEAAVLPKLIDKIRPLTDVFHDDLRILIVNDGSTDQTEPLLRAYADRDPRLLYINHPRNKGLGEVWNTMFRYVCSHYRENDILVTMDADNTHNPRIVPPMVRKLIEEDLDVVIASRFTSGGKELGLSWFRKLTSRGARLFFKLFFSIPNVNDYTSGFRCYRIGFLQKAMNRYGQRLVVSKGFESTAEIMARFSRLGRAGGGVSACIGVPLERREEQDEGGPNGLGLFVPAQNQEPMTHVKRRIVTGIILALIAAVRLFHIADSPYEYDSWRQSDTESIAINFVESRFNIFYPQLNYDGPLPNVAQLEFQITTFLIALLYKGFGYHYALARLVPILFFTGSAYFIYLIGKKYYSVRAAWFALLVYGFLPLNLLYSRAIMPESAALFFYLGAFYGFARWMETKKRMLLVLSGMFTALAISQKVPTIFVGIPMLVMAIKHFKASVWRRAELWLFAGLALVPPYLYFKWLSTVAEYTFVSGIASKHIVPHMLTAVFTPEALQFFYKELPKAFTWYGLVLFAAGFAFTRWRKEYPLGVWALAMLLELSTIVAVIKFNYYLIFLSPLIALYSAKVLDVLASVRLRPVVVLLVILFGYSSFRQIQPYLNTQKTDLIRQAEIVRQFTDKEDLIAVGTDDPSLLNACHRRGWRIANTYPDDPIAEIRYFQENGAKYFVPLKGYIDYDDGTVRRFLDANFEKIEPVKDYPIYKLR